MATVLLSNGFAVVIDDDLVDWFARWTWRAHQTEPGRLYVVRSSNGRLYYLHREVMSAGRGQTVDHANGDPLDNRRSNLRFCTPSQNAANTARPRGASGFRGVYRDRRKWRAAIEFERRKHYLGRFESQEEAARAYDAAARQLHGEFAIVNFPEGVGA